MIKSRIHTFPKNNIVAVIDFGFSKLITGSFFNDNSIIDKYNHNNSTSKERKDLPSDMDVEQEAFSISISKANNKPQKHIMFTKEEKEKISNIIENTEYIVITSLSEILCYPYILKKLGISHKIKFLTTFPIAQIAKYYLKDFYSILNKILLDELKFTEDDSDTITMIEDSEIDSFVEDISRTNFGELLSTSFPNLNIKLISSGYELGSSNILIQFYNKTIGIISNSSNFLLRYPKEFDRRILKDSDVLILLPNVINYSSDYESQLAKLTSEIYKTSSKVDINSEYYPAIFMPTSPLFLLDFVDFIRYKVPKEVKHVYISKSIKSILEYANISHGFINEIVHNKIYEFKLPFNFDELLKSSSLYLFNDFEEVLNSVSALKIKNTPTILMVDKFSFCFPFAESHAVFENFLYNASTSDALILLDESLAEDGLEIFEQKNFSINTYKSHMSVVKNRHVFHIDHRIPIDQFKKLFSENISKNSKENITNDKKFYYAKSELNQIEFEKFLNSVPKCVEKLEYIDCQFEIYFEKEKLIYDRSYLVTSSTNEFEKFFDILNQSNKCDRNFMINAEKQNETFYVKLTPDLDHSKNSKNNFERFEFDLNRILKSNNMKINEFLCRENKIHISIINSNENNSYSDVIIVLKEENLGKTSDCDFEISVTSENYEDSHYLNNILQMMFNPFN